MIKVTATDKAFSLAVREACDWTCQKCGRRTPQFSEGVAMETAHNFSRRLKITRHDPRNATCLCKGCHRNFTLNPHLHVEFFMAYLGDDYELMRRRYHGNPRRYPKHFDKALREHYRAQYAQICLMRENGLQGMVKLAVPKILVSDLI